MTDHATFLASIIANPKDDAPRLIYADWLEEQGQSERAEFIRIQCELAKLPPQQAQLSIEALESAIVSPAVPGSLGSTAAAKFVASEFRRIASLKRRERELIDARGFGWCDGLLGPDWKTRGILKDGCRVEVRYGVNFPNMISETSPMACIFQRGLIGEIGCTWRNWSGHHKAILSETPLRTVYLRDRPNLVLKSTAFLIGTRAVKEEEQIPFGWSLEGCETVHFLPEAGRRVDLNWPGHPGYDPNFVWHLLSSEWPGIDFELPRRQATPLDPHPMPNLQRTLDEASDLIMRAAGTPANLFHTDAP